MQGYDTTMMGGMNILPQYTAYFHLNQALRSFNIASNYTGGCLAVGVISPFPWHVSRRPDSPSAPVLSF